MLLRQTLLWLQVDISEDASTSQGPLAALFAEELGLVLEVHSDHEAEVRATYEAQGLSAVALGSTCTHKGVSISVGGEPAIQGIPCSCMSCIKLKCPFLGPGRCSRLCLSTQAASNIIASMFRVSGRAGGFIARMRGSKVL